MDSFLSRSAIIALTPVDETKVIRPSQPMDNHALLLDKQLQRRQAKLPMAILAKARVQM
ncbi:hypothetical protein [Mesorhizobium sp.]|uniref:hypothetical protein n=1 Tax=Mesorhizobium sp. TaxID=1871066 RepID=UPI00257BBDE7|nr:hypothetical protein [Mesorhizobium sp.]